MLPPFSNCNPVTWGAFKNNFELKSMHSINLFFVYFYTIFLSANTNNSPDVWCSLKSQMAQSIQEWIM